MRLAHPRRLGLAAAAATSLCAVVVTTALAVDEVDAGRAIAVNAGANFVELTGYPANTDLQVEVKRGGVTVGSTVKHTDTGDIEINHLGGDDCWGGASTPDIQGGDEIFVTVLDGGVPVGTDSANVRDLHLDSAESVGDTIVLTGSVLSHPDAALAGGAVNAEVRIPGIEFKSDPVEIAAEGPFSIVFDEEEGVAAEEAGAFNPAGDRAEITWADAGEQITNIEDFGGDPPVAAPECPPLAETGITDTSHDAINLANVNTPMAVSGVAQPGVTEVSVAIGDGQAHQVALADEPTQRPWSVEIPPNELAELADGPVDIVATFNGPGGTDTLTVDKDTAAPAAPTATPGAGTYTRSQAVSLAGPSADTAELRWTSGAGDPDLPYTGAIQVTATQTLKAIAVDDAGNPSEVAAFAYVIQPATCAGCGAPPQQRPEPQPEPQSPRTDGGGGIVQDPLTAFRVRSLRAPGRMSLRTARRRGVTARFLAPEGTQLVQASLFLHTPRSSRARRLVKRLTFTVDGAGRYAARFGDRRTRRKLRRGIYTISVAPGVDSTTFAEGTAKRFRIR